MKELSFLMLIIAIITGLSVLLKNILHKDLENKTYFITPSTAYFNIAWGTLFYLGYGQLKTTSSILHNSFSFLIALTVVYLSYLYLLRRYLNGRKIFIFSPLFKKIITVQAVKQNILDKSLNIPYSAEKSRKILGLEKSQISSFEKIDNAAEKLKILNIPALSDIAVKSQNSLKAVIKS